MIVFFFDVYAHARDLHGRTHSVPPRRSSDHTGRDKAVLPKTVIYGPELLVSLPASITGPSGLNAIAHAVEALYAPEANPITSLMAEEAIRAIGQGLPKSIEAPDDIGARSSTLYGAWLAGATLGLVGMGDRKRTRLNSIH